MCAERVAIYKAIAEGEKDFYRIAIYGESKDYCMPCGACRQVMVELCDEATPVLLANLTGATRETSVAALLPGSFKLPQAN